MSRVIKRCAMKSTNYVPALKPAITKANPAPKFKFDAAKARKMTNKSLEDIDIELDKFYPEYQKQIQDAACDGLFRCEIEIFKVGNEYVSLSSLFHTIYAFKLMERLREDKFEVKHHFQERKLIVKW